MRAPEPHGGLHETLRRRYPQHRADSLAIVEIPRQRLLLIQNGRLRESYPVSTAARGTGNRAGSYQTPLGLFFVAEKYGEGAPLGAMFKGRRFTGEIASIFREPEERTRLDLVTTRILRLSGLQPGYNLGGEVDTFSRYIYIHGTPEEYRIGTPASQGCVRMRNDDVISLYEAMPLHGLVWIIDACWTLGAPPPDL